MIVNAAVFTCSICGEPSTNICAYCTKDACANHRCERCKRCSDCCECDVPLSAEEAASEVEVAPEPVPGSVPEPTAEVAPESVPDPVPEHTAEAAPFIEPEELTDPTEQPDPIEPRDEQAV
jgi:hypothetical protein